MLTVAKLKAIGCTPATQKAATLGQAMRIIDLFILGADIQSTITMLHPVTQAARLWCSTQAIGEWANDVLTVASVEHLTTIINAIPDCFETVTI